VKFIRQISLFITAAKIFFKHKTFNMMNLFEENNLWIWRHQLISKEVFLNVPYGINLYKEMYPQLAFPQQPILDWS
jgi:hypothetical protein